MSIDFQLLFKQILIGALVVIAVSTPLLLWAFWDYIPGWIAFLKETYGLAR